MLLLEASTDLVLARREWKREWKLPFLVQGLGFRVWVEGIVAFVLNPNKIVQSVSPKILSNSFHFLHSFSTQILCPQPHNPAPSRVVHHCLPVLAASKLKTFRPELLGVLISFGIGVKGSGFRNQGLRFRV